MKNKPHYINMVINFSILALLIYLAVQIHEIKNPPRYQPAVDTRLELEQKGDVLALAIMNKLLAELAQK